MTRARLALIAGLAGLTLSCASSQVTLAPAGDGEEAGSVAIANPKTGQELAVSDGTGNVSAAGARVETTDAATFEARYGDLLAALPQAPKSFTLYFKAGSAEPTPESMPLLDQIFTEIKSRPGADLQIIGHTDTVGSLELNDRLSLERAAEVTSFLFSLGLDKTIVRISGRGERELREATPDDTPSDINRRVEVIVR